MVLAIADIDRLIDGLAIEYAKAEAQSKSDDMKRIRAEYDILETMRLFALEEEEGAFLEIMRKRIAAVEAIVRRLNDTRAMLALQRYAEKEGLPIPGDQAQDPFEAGEEDPAPGTDDNLAIGETVDHVKVNSPPAQPGDGSMLVSEAHLLALWKRSKFPIDGRGIIIFGIRGCLPVDPSGTAFASSHKVTKQDTDYRRMRCTIGQWRPGKGFALFPGSTVPYAPLVEGAVSDNGTGVNQLGRGRYRNYFPYWHKRSEKENGHWALVQDSDTTFQRTANDAKYDVDDKWDVGRPGDNIHCAFHIGPDDAIPDSKYSSAGCQVIAGTVIKGKWGSESGPWKKFIAPFRGDDRQQGVEYVLFDGTELQQLVLSNMVGKTFVLRMGSEGPLVTQLQQRLSEKLGIPIGADGIFGAQTFRAVIDFQQQNFGFNGDDGIVGPETAEKLGFSLPEFNFHAAISQQDEPEAHPAQPASDKGVLTHQLFEKFAPPPTSGSKRNIYDAYVNYFVSEPCAKLLAKYGISESTNRLAHYFAQAAHETGKFTLLRESLHYTTVKAVRKAWKQRASKYSDDWIVQNILKNPVAIGDWAYGGRMGNKKGTRDGFDYRGGGTFQTTGRSAYRAKGKLAGIDLEGNPSLIEEPAISTLAACAEWDSFNGNKLADDGKIRNISRAINIGDANSSNKSNGEDERIALFDSLKKLLN